MKRVSQFKVATPSSLRLHDLNYGCQRKLLRVISLGNRRSISHAQTHPVKKVSCDVIRCPEATFLFPVSVLIFSNILCFLDRLIQAHTADP